MEATVGHPAPVFSLPDETGRQWNLSDWHGQKRVLLVFYAADFNPVCAGEMDLIGSLAADFMAENTVVAAISCDNTYCHQEFKRRKGQYIPFLSDFWPHGEVARAYGVFDHQLGMSRRGAFLIDEHGVIIDTLVRDISAGRPLDDWRALLDKARAA